MLEEVGITASKRGNFAEWYLQVVLKAELADYAPVKGMMVLRPDGYSIWESLKTALDGRLRERDVRNAFLPVLIPESLLQKETDHFAGFNLEAFWVTHSGDAEIGDRLALRPTSETLAYSMYAKWIQSWRDLPLKINFWNTALRAEIKGTKPFLRTSEFLWQEGHTAHAAESEAREEVEAILEIYRSMAEEVLAVPVITGRKSESEKFVGAEYTCTMESMMPDGRALQMGTSHLLGQNFSRPFGVKFSDKDNVEHFVWQTSWGVSWRLIGAMIMVHGDDQGLVLPPRVAPIQVVIIPIRAEQMQDAQKIKNRLQGVRTHVDGRDLTPGYKFNDWEMRGVPVRLEIGPRDVRNGQVTVSARTNPKQKRTVDAANIRAAVLDMLDAVQSDMLARARAQLDGMTFDASSIAEIKKSMGGGFVRAPWCGSARCEDTIREETGGEIRVIPDIMDVEDRCAVCGDAAASAPLFARGY